MPFVFLVFFVISCGFKPSLTPNSPNKRLNILCSVLENKLKSERTIQDCYFLKKELERNEHFDSFDGKLKITLVPTRNFYIYNRAFASFLQINYQIIINYSLEDVKFTSTIDLSNFNETVESNFMTEFSSEKNLRESILQKASKEIVLRLKTAEFTQAD